MLNISSGVTEAWELLAGLDPEQVTVRARVGFDGESYRLKCFREELEIFPARREIRAGSPLGRYLLEDLADYSRLSVLRYLVDCRNVPLSGNWTKPRNTGPGQIYFSGSHKLPLEQVAARFAPDIPCFLARGRALGGEPLPYGDASIMLLPFPRIALALVLWRADEEFPARADLLFDAACSTHLPPDIMWSTAMMTILYHSGQTC